MGVRVHLCVSLERGWGWLSERATRANKTKRDGVEKRELLLHASNTPPHHHSKTPLPHPPPRPIPTLASVEDVSNTSRNGAPSPKGGMYCQS